VPQREEVTSTLESGRVMVRSSFASPETPFRKVGHW
jgi:hypothetical protein